MARPWTRWIGLAVYATALATAAAAQTTGGSIAGEVRDTSGGVLPGVTVEATSSALIEKARTVVTDGTGQYKILELRPGSYTVSFSLPGFSVVKREGIELTTGFTATINAELRVGDVTETITVTGESPIIDVQNTKQQFVATRDVIEQVPTGRSFQNLGVLVPGMVGAGAIGQLPQDVGGQSGQNFLQLSIHGGRGSDQRIEVDGMTLSHWSRPDASAVVFADGNFQEFAIEFAANSAETETGGVRINMIPKEGGNRFSGRFFGEFSSSKLESDNYTPELRSRGLLVTPGVKSLWSTMASLGGPLVRDRLWFFGAATKTTNEQYVAGSYVNANPAGWEYVRTNEQAVDDEFTRDFSGRITWQATQRNKIAAYVSYNHVCKCHFAVGGPNSADGSIYKLNPNYLAQGTWMSPATNRLLLEAAGSYNLQDIHFNPRPESVAPRITDIGLGLSYRAAQPAPSGRSPATNWQARGSASYVTGGHTLKAGASALFGNYEENRSIVGNMSFTTLNSVPTAVTYWGTPVKLVNRVWPSLGLYAQDQWTVKKFTVNAGLRFDHFRSNYPDQNVPPTQFVPVARSFPGVEAVSWKDLNPRLGLVYDLFGTGKTAVKATWSRYVIPDGTSRAGQINPIFNNISMTRQWVDRDGDRVPDGDPLDPTANDELGPSQNLNFGRPVISVRFDPEWATGFAVRPSNWEASAGVQHELIPRVSLNAAYFHREYGNFAISDNLAVGPSDFSPYCVTAPQDSRLLVSGQQICGLFDLNQNRVGQVNAYWRSASDFGEQTEYWNGGDFTINVRLAAVLLQGGVSTGKTVTDSCDVVTKVDNPSTFYCHTETPFLTQVKLLGFYTLPWWQVQVSGTYQSTPGPAATGSAAFTNAQIAPTLGRPLSQGTTATVNLVEPGTLYGERLHQLDLRFTKKLNVGGSRIQGMVDVYNALNGNAVVRISNTYGATTGPATGSAFLVPQGIVSPRLVKFSAQLTF